MNEVYVHFHLYPYTNTRDDNGIVKVLNNEYNCSCDPW